MSEPLSTFRKQLAAAGRPPRRARRLAFVLGDQLDPGSALLRGLEPEADAVLMVEVAEESTHVASHRQRTVLFLSAMRHFALGLARKGRRVRYVTLDEATNTQAFGSELERAIRQLSTESVSVIRPGEHRVERAIREACRRTGAALQVLEDDSVTCSLEEFERWAQGRKSLTMEYFYRERRRALDVLIDGTEPEGGRWNLDHENRKAFKSAPTVPAAYRPRPDALTREVAALVEAALPDAPGRLEHFHWPVEPDQARRALRKFIDERLPRFGTYEDAMWTGESRLYHSALSSSLNLKLLEPRRCVDAAVAAYRDGRATLNNVEGFVRQVIGWREFVRGVYYREGEGYAFRDGLGQDGALPSFFWDARTEMNCLRHCVDEVLEHAYGHHIARLMVIGNFALIAGVAPRLVHEWFLGMYVDGVEWATAPNVVGMSQYADGGVVATKPYAASGKYIQRMSNYCEECRYDVKQRAGPDACPFNTFYWDFLLRHRQRFQGNQRMGMVMKNADRLPVAERRLITRDALALREELGIHAG